MLARLQPGRQEWCPYGKEKADLVGSHAGEDTNSGSDRLTESPEEEPHQNRDESPSHKPNRETSIRNK